jgi:hypothetical protein
MAAKRSRRHLSHALCLSLWGLAASCATPVTVSADFDRTVNFARYHTFGFAGGHLEINGVSDDGNTIVKDRIRNAIVSVMTSKGFVEVPANPDVVVGYFAGARSRTEIESMPPYTPEVGPFWYGGWWGPGYADWWTRTYEEGTLVIDLVDHTTQRLVWRAYARAEVSTPLTDEKIHRGIAKAFERYPPHP